MVGGNDPAGIKMYRSTAQTLAVSATVPTQIIFNAEEWDNGNNGNAVAGNYTAPEACLMRVDARIGIATGAVGERFIIELWEDGVEIMRGSDIVVAGAYRCSVHLNGVFLAAANHVYDVRVHQVNGTARAIDLGSVQSYMMMSRA
jgi:hypothetical protein